MPNPKKNPPQPQPQIPPTDATLEELLSLSAVSSPAEAEKGASEPEVEPVVGQVATLDDPEIDLGSLATESLDDVPPGTFSDEPPPGFMPPEHPVVGMDRPLDRPAPGQAIRPELRAAPGKVFPRPGYFAPDRDRASEGPDPKYDPKAVNAARASLLEDAERSRTAARPSAEPSVPTGAPRRPNADLAVQHALHTHEMASQGPSSLPPAQSYRSRVSVSTAYRYDGAVRSAPDFIDRNWAAYDNGGPALNIPNVGLLHVGEWLVVQDILDDDGSVALTEFKIYDDYLFNSMFMPVGTSRSDFENLPT